MGVELRIMQSIKADKSHNIYCNGIFGIRQLICIAEEIAWKTKQITALHQYPYIALRIS